MNLLKPFNMPAVVKENLEKIENMSVGDIAEMINLRAGRMPEYKVKAKRIINQFNLIESELLEGKRAALAGDVTQVRDAVADIILLAAGQQSILGGIDVEGDYRLMCAFNMTRIPQTMEEAVATLNKYSELGIETYIDEVEVEGKMLYPVKTIAAREQVDYNGEHYAPNKFLKSVNFHDAAYPEVQYAEILDTSDRETVKAAGSLFREEHYNAVEMAIAVTLEGNDMTPEQKDAAELFLQTIKKLINKRF